MWFPKLEGIPPNHVQSCFFLKSFPALRPKNSALGKMIFMLPGKPEGPVTPPAKVPVRMPWVLMVSANPEGWWKQDEPPSRVSEEVLGGWELSSQKYLPEKWTCLLKRDQHQKGKDCLPVPSFFEYPLRSLFDEKDWDRQQSSTVFYVRIMCEWIDPGLGHDFGVRKMCFWVYINWCKVLGLLGTSQNGTVFFLKLGSVWTP